MVMKHLRPELNTIFFLAFKIFCFQCIKVVNFCRYQLHLPSFMIPVIALKKMILEMLLRLIIIVYYCVKRQQLLWKNAFSFWELVHWKKCDSKKSYAALNAVFIYLLGCSCCYIDVS